MQPPKPSHPPLHDTPSPAAAGAPPQQTHRPTRQRRETYPSFRAIPTRWADNDAYGHVNNVVYYAFFDTVVNTWLLEQGLLDIAAGPVIGLVVETGCHYFEAVAFPDVVHAGLRVAHLGRSCVRYEIGLFRGDSELAVAQGHFVHVYVDRAERRPVPLPEAMRAALAGLASA